MLVGGDIVKNDVPSQFHPNRGEQLAALGVDNDATRCQARASSPSGRIDGQQLLGSSHGLRDTLNLCTIAGTIRSQFRVFDNATL
jgi:hypothetical protein